MSVQQRTSIKSTLHDSTTAPSEKSALQDAFSHRSGFQIFNDSKRLVTESSIPTVQEGIVYYVLNDGKPTEYWTVSSGRKPKTGLCIKAYYPSSICSSANPKDFYESNVKPNMMTSTESEKAMLKNMCLAIIDRLDTFAPLKDGSEQPKPGDKVRLHFISDPLVPVGEKIKGYYEVISTLDELGNFFDFKSSYDVDQEFFNFIGASSQFTQAVNSIINSTKSNVSEIVEYGSTTVAETVNNLVESVSSLFSNDSEGDISAEPKNVLSEKDKNKLQGVNQQLIKVVEAAAAISNIKFTITEGVRTLETQKMYYNSGKSTTMNSKHLKGNAVDLAAIVDGKIKWDWQYYEEIAKAMKTASSRLGIPIIWGGDWENFKDGVHFELR